MPGRTVRAPGHHSWRPFQLAFLLVNVPPWPSRPILGDQPVAGAIARLVDAGILVETTGRSYGRVFAAQAVIRILER